MRKLRKLFTVGALLAASTLTICQPVMAATKVVIAVNHHHRYHHRYYRHHHYYYR
jgi:hypothetical protein